MNQDREQGEGQQLQAQSAGRQAQGAGQQQTQGAQGAGQQTQNPEQQFQGAEKQSEQNKAQSRKAHTQQHGHHQVEQHNPVHAPIPGLGFRSIKTALATMFTALLYAFLPDSNPTFACIGAIFGMGADMEESRRSGGNRFFGTVIGGFIGLGLYWLEHMAYPEGCYWLRLPMVFLGVIVLISMCVLFHWPGGVQPGGVVLCIILFNTPPHHIDYAIHRMIDTGIGVIVALLVNYFLPRSRLEHWFHLDQERRRKRKQAENGSAAAQEVSVSRSGEGV